ncbi:MAG TPA: hypothetical protein VH917_03605 [Ignavibacteriaceae bacterium]
MMKISGFFAVVIVLIILVFGFLFFEPFITEKVETINVINKERWIGERRSYFIFTEKEVFVNMDNQYHNKENADKLYLLLKPGFSYKVKVVGMSIPFLTRFRNIIDIIEDRETNVPLTNPKPKN